MLLLWISFKNLNTDLEGFEPGVFGLEVRRPIQLGYGPLIYNNNNSIFLIIYIYLFCIKKIKKD